MGVMFPLVEYGLQTILACDAFGIAFVLNLCFFEIPMNFEKLVFSQIVDQIHREEFSRCVNSHPMPRASRSFSARDQFLSMAFAQITYRESLRDIEACLNHSPHLYFMGFRGHVTRTNLAYANEHRHWKVYEQLAQILIKKARLLHKSETSSPDLEEVVYALDSSTIDLCLTIFPWAKFRKTKAAIKLHTLIDLNGNIPVFICTSDGLLHDVNVLDVLIIERNAIYVMDRGYVDYARLFSIHHAGAYFVTRTKRNMKFRVIESQAFDSTSGVRCDQIIRLSSDKGKADYPEVLRRISYRDSVTGKRITFLTNIFHLSSVIVARLYKNRWQIELFFKWIKQNLRIKTFFGTSDNAVKTQIWIAASVYLLIMILKKQAGIKKSFV
jgi:hypothetical protein